LKTAIVHEWLVNYAGSEKCVESFVNIWKDADVFTLVDFLSDEERQIILKGKKANTSLIQKLPFAKKHHRTYLPLFPFAIEQFDLSGYDVVISSCHSIAKGVLTSSEQLHICYCYTPIRYGWDLYHQYIKEANLEKGIKGLFAKLFLHKIRMWDYTTANRVDYFIAISNFIARRIKKIYNRSSEVIYPPVDIEKFGFCDKKENYYLAASRFVPYKRMDLIIEAFSKMPDKKLVVIGDGFDEKKIKAIATKNIEFMGYQPQEKLIEYMQKAKAFVFAAIEDFGITVIEAHACGTPVIALNKGGTAETVEDGVNGLHFNEQTPASIIEAVNKFEKIEDKFDLKKIHNSALKYSRANFEKNIYEYVNLKCKDFFNLK
jgi:glycosyltransferase involved in cell wall biosynthesis